MDLGSTSACDLVTSLRDGTCTAQDVMAATYDRIDAWNPHVNALVSLLDREAALALAGQADVASKRGPLHGLPIAVKDLTDAAGFVTTKGSPLLTGTPPATRDHIVVARMRAAGALVIGKSNTPEFGFGSHTTNPVHGPTRNPWDLSRTPGGSSGGASVAVATGMLALADGSDMMGSLRNPAGWTNTYGLRPTWGAVPDDAAGDVLRDQLSTMGPLARSPEDLALLLSVIAGPDPRQPFGLTLPPPGPARPLRIGWLGDWGGAYAMEAGILDLCEGALEIFSALGHDVAPCDAPFSCDALWEAWTILRAWQNSATLRGRAPTLEARALLGGNAQWELAQGNALTGEDVQRASVIASQWFARAKTLFDRFDLLALPTAQCWPFDVDLDWPREIAGQEMDTYHRWMEVVVPASLIGLPALAVPAGFGPQGLPAQGLPMGLQLIGPRGSDRDLLALGQTFHEAAPWTRWRPPLPAR